MGCRIRLPARKQINNISIKEVSDTISDNKSSLCSLSCWLPRQCIYLSSHQIQVQVIISTLSTPISVTDLYTLSMYYFRQSWFSRLFAHKNWPGFSVNRAVTKRGDFPLRLKWRRLRIHVCQRQLFTAINREMLVNVKVPWKKLPILSKEFLLYHLVVRFPMA